MILLSWDLLDGELVRPICCVFQPVAIDAVTLYILVADTLCAQKMVVDLVQDISSDERGAVPVLPLKPDWTRFRLSVMRIELIIVDDEAVSRKLIAAYGDTVVVLRPEVDLFLA